MNYRLIIFGCLLTALVAACAEQNTNLPADTPAAAELSEEDPWANLPTQEEDPLPEAPLKELLSALKDSVERTWYLSVKSDEKKLAKILQLTARLEKYPQHNKSTADSVRLLHKWLTNNPLTWEILADANQTLIYDTNFETLIQLVRRLRETPGSESCTACTELYDEVIASYDDDLILRRRYDRFAALFNQLIEKKKDSIRLLPPPLNQAARKPLFMPETLSL